MSKVRDVIAALSKLDSELEVYFDCPTCEHSNVFHMATPVVLIKTAPESKPGEEQGK